jgi:hypothetical protein
LWHKTWLKINPAGYNGLCCWNCAEERLGRKLTPEDLPPITMNDYFRKEIFGLEPAIKLKKDSRAQMIMLSKVYPNQWKVLGQYRIKPRK